MVIETMTEAQDQAQKVRKSIFLADVVLTVD